MNKLKMNKLTLVMATSLALFGGNAMAKYSVKAIANGGVVQGAVKFEGQPPAPTTALIGKDNEVCGDGEIVPNPIAIGVDGALENVVVYLHKVKAGKAWPKKQYEVVQTKCAFLPYLQVVPKGVKLTIKNNDPVLHNVHPFEIIGDSRRTLFNLAQPKQNQVNKKKIKTRKGKAVELSCDAHSWMAGWLYVLEHPYYAVVDADGRYNIDEVPPGDYKLVAWHPVLGTREQDVTIGADAAVDASFSFSAKQ